MQTCVCVCLVVHSYGPHWSHVKNNGGVKFSEFQSLSVTYPWFNKINNANAPEASLTQIKSNQSPALVKVNSCDSFYTCSACVCVCVCVLVYFMFFLKHAVYGTVKRKHTIAKISHQCSHQQVNMCKLNGVLCLDVDVAACVCVAQQVHFQIILLLYMIVGNRFYR